VRKIIATGQPRTLMQAHRELVRIRPSRDASSVAWLAYYQRSASVYEQIAKIDPGHVAMSTLRGSGVTEVAGYVLLSM
jgi:hypothetical protein